MRCKKIIFFILLAFIGISSIQAEQATVDYQAGIFSNRIGTDKTYSGQLGYLLVDGNIVYCLDPYRIVGDYYERNNDYLNQFLKEDIEYFELVAGYVKEKVNNREIYYYMAAQELIWERMIGDKVYWTTEKNGGTEINIENYKEEIKEYLRQYYRKPSIDKMVVEDNFFKTIILEDTNNTLSNYEVITNTKSEVLQYGNKLQIKILSSEEEEIKLVRKIENGETYYYHSDTNQDLINLSGSVTSEITIKVKADNKYSVPALFNFFDSEFSTLINGGIKFKLYNLDTDEYSEEYQLYNGKLELTSLEKGNYQLIVTNVPKNYIIENNYFFEIEDDIPYEYPPGTFYTVNTYLEKTKGQITIYNHKDTTEYQLYASSNIYDIHNNIIYKKGELIKSEIIGKEGVLIMDVPLGNYSIIDQNTNKKYDISLEYQDPYTKIVKEKLEIEDIPVDNENNFTEENTFPLEKEEIVPEQSIIHSNLKTLPNTFDYMSNLKLIFLLLITFNWIIYKKCQKNY